MHVLEWLLPQVNAAALTVPTKSGWCVLHTAARAEHGRAVEVTAMMLRRCRDLGLFTPERLAIPGDGEQDGVTTSVSLNATALYGVPMCACVLVRVRASKRTG